MENIARRFCGRSVYASSPLEFLQHGAASLTNRGVVLVLANVRRVIPAAVALRAFGFFDFDVNPTAAVRSASHQLDRRDNKQVAQLIRVADEDCVHTIFRGYPDL